MLTTENASAIVRDPITDREADKYRRMWSVSDYHGGSPGKRQAGYIAGELTRLGAKSVVEIGAGSGRLAWDLHLRGFTVHMVDIVDNALDAAMWKRLSGRLTFTLACAWSDEVAALRADATVSTDVLEHIPPERLEQTLDTFKAIAPHGVHGIALNDDVCGKLIGEKLHLSLHDIDWWRQAFERRFGGVLVRKMQHSYIQLRY